MRHDRGVDQTSRIAGIHLSNIITGIDHGHRFWFERIIAAKSPSILGCNFPRFVLEVNVPVLRWRDDFWVLHLCIDEIQSHPPFALST